MARKKPKKTSPADEQSPPESPEKPPDSLEEELKALQEAFEQVRKERDDYLDSLQRKQAEFENFRKRMIREKEEIHLSAQTEVFRQLLPVLDSCETGLQSLPDAAGDARLAAYRDGLELILSSLQSLLQKFEIAEVPGAGAPFDPNVHEAVLREETDDATDGEVIEEFRKGYLLKDRLIRPAQVKVAVKVEIPPT